MTKKSDAPAIRFKGFSDAWEQRKLGDVATFFNGRAYSQPELLSSGKYKVLRVGNFYTNDSWYYSDLELGEKYYADYGDLLYTWSATFGPHIWLGDRVIYHYHIWKIDLSNQLEKQFAVQLLEQDKANILSSKNGSTMVHITKEGMEQKDVIIPPSTKEQQEIGAFFQQLDNLITLHQRQPFLHSTPEISLTVQLIHPFYTSSWEQRKLGDIGKARSGIGFPDADQGGLTGVPFFKVSDMNSDGNENEMTVANNYVTAEQIADHRWSPITELPAIFFAKVGAAVMLNRKRLCRFPFLLDNNTMAYSLSPTKWDADFAKALFGTVDLTSLVQVGALPSYNAGDVESMEIYLPSLLEQEQIGAYFKRLDNLITLHQRKPFFMKWRTSDANRNQTNRLVL